MSPAGSADGGPLRVQYTGELEQLALQVEMMGIVVDQSEQVRHVYYVVAYTEQAFALRLTYDPAHPEALDVYRAVLDSWAWG